MLVIVLGASSYIGCALAQAFCLSNTMILVGRTSDTLTPVANSCKGSGALQVICIEEDLAVGVNSLLQAIEGQQVDLIIDAASASSRKRDSEIDWNEISHLVSADFLSRTKIMDYLLRSQDVIPAVIFISTILTLVKSPGRTIYTAIKSLSETYLEKLKDDRTDLHLLVVHVGTVIETNAASIKAQELATAVVKAFKSKKRKLLFGVSGIFFIALFYFQPFIFYLVTMAQRQIRRWIG